MGPGPYQRAWRREERGLLGGSEEQPATSSPECQAYPCPPPWAVEFCSWSGGHDVPDWAGEQIWRFFEAAP